MSFIHKKFKVFDSLSKQDEDMEVEVYHKRSEGRMKTYQSATDTRCWALTREERRQHFLDLVKDSKVKNFLIKNLTPSTLSVSTIGTFINILLANAKITPLQMKIDEVRDLFAEQELWCSLLGSTRSSDNCEKSEVVVVKQRNLDFSSNEGVVAREFVTIPDRPSVSEGHSLSKNIKKQGESKRLMQNNFEKKKNLKRNSKQSQTENQMTNYVSKGMQTILTDVSPTIINILEQMERNLSHKNQVGSVSKNNEIESFQSEYESYKYRLANLKKIEECRQLTITVENLNEENQQLVKQLNECEYHIRTQKKKIKKLLSHIDFLNRQHHKQLRGGTTSNLPVEEQQMITQSSLNMFERSVCNGKMMESQSQFVNSVKKSISAMTKIKKTSNTVNTLELLQNLGDNIKTKIELEKEKTKESVAKYTNTMTNLMVQIDVIKRANSEYTKKSHRCFNDTLVNIFDESDVTDVICSCPDDAKFFKAKKHVSSNKW